MKYNDIIRLAKALDDTMPDIAKNNDGHDIRSQMQINIEVEPDNLSQLNQELYLQMHPTLEGFVESDEIKLNVWGLNFQITMINTDSKI